jgi:hypothetical protein
MIRRLLICIAVLALAGCMEGTKSEPLPRAAANPIHKEADR